MAALNKIVADNAPKVIKGHAGQRIRDARKAMREAQPELELISKTKKMHREFLGKAGEIITDAGGKISERLGEGYHQVAKEIADNIKNFQGKKIRSFDEAIASLNKITANPAMKFNSSDKAVIVNAWKQVNAKDMAEKLGNLSKAFKVSEIILKVEKIREKSVEGI